MSNSVRKFSELHKFMNFSWESFRWLRHHNFAYYAMLIILYWRWRPKGGEWHHAPPIKYAPDRTASYLFVKFPLTSEKN